MPLGSPAAVALLLAVLVMGAGCKKQDEARPPETPPPTAAADESEPLEEPEESPYLDVANFNRVVESHHPEVVGCYRETVGKASGGASVEGRVKVTLVINADGRVKQVTFDEQRSTLKDPALNKCIEGKTAGWVFNISLTGADTPMPYTFDLSQGGLLGT